MRLASLLSSRADERPAHPFVSFPDGEVSYGELHDRAAALARGPLGTGLEPGGHVGILMTNCVAYQEVFFAIQLAGGVPARARAAGPCAILKHPREEGPALFRHHGHDKPLTEAERDKLLGDGAAIQGMVMHNEPTEADRRIARIRVTVTFKDGQLAEFSEELASLYQPAPGSPEAQRLAEVRGAQQLRHADRIPKIQLPLSAGERVPVRYDAHDRSRIVVDVPALHERALHDYIKREQTPTPTEPSRIRTGPPWTVPAHCPECGAPVDQARASRDPDPRCPFCHQPVPVQPVNSA